MARTNNMERKSTIKGVWIDMQSQAFNEYEIETDYTRSLDKALKLAKEIINPDNNENIVVTVKEIVNEKAARRYYDNAAIYAEAREMCYGQAEAEDIAEEAETVVKGIVYEFDTNIFAYNTAAETYAAKAFHWSCGNNVTAKDARAMLAMRFEEINPDWRTIAMHVWGNTKGYVKRETQVWFVIDKQTLQDHCMKEDKEA